MAKQTSFTYKLTPEQQTTLQTLLSTGNYRPLRVEHTTIAVDAEGCKVNLYKSGKCLVQGKGAAEFVEFVLEPMVLQSVSLGYEDVLDPQMTQPHIGVDESGKGDFFGPLVIAAVYVDKPLVEKMREMGVKDSKNISSDDKALGMGSELRKLLGNRFKTVRIGPASYNRLYMKMRNVNTMLAWGHARAIEDVLESVPDCPRAISDQFGNKRLIEQALMKRGKKIKLEQMPRAESDTAVAAASVIAREIFLRGLKDLGSKFDIQLRKGASDLVREAAVELVRKRGPATLVDVAKCHFQTADKVLATAGLDRSKLPPEGQITSRVKSGDFKRK